MKELPEAKTYEQGLLYWPYKYSLHMVHDLVLSCAPPHGTLLDIMCGPGYLLGRIAALRPDLQLTGVDIDERYVGYGRDTYPTISFEKGDVLNWKSGQKFDFITCTGALHHVPDHQQELAVACIAALVKPSGFAVISDCYIDDYSDETERRLEAAKLGYEYLNATIRNHAPDDVIGWTVDIITNDVLHHEYKTSLRKRLPMLNRHFGDIATNKAWPKVGYEYGDYVHLCSSPT